MFIKKIATLTISFSLLIAASSVNAEIIKRTLNTPDAMLFKRMFVEKSITMPQLKVFNDKGVILYETNTKDDKLIDNVLSAIKKPDRDGTNQFDEHLSGFIDTDGKNIALKDIGSSKLVFVESYVDWFDGSQSNRQDLQQVLARLHGEKVLWLELDVDPKKMESASVTITNID